MQLSPRLLAAGLLGSLAGCTAILGIDEPGSAVADGGGADAPGAADAGADAGSYMPDVQMTLAPVRVLRGSDAQLVVDLGAPPPPGVTVTVTIEDLPTGVQAPGQAVIAPDSQAIFSVAAEPMAQLGAAQITVRAAFMGLSDTETTSLLVADPPGAPDVLFTGDGQTTLSVGGNGASGVAVGVLSTGHIVVGLTVAGNWTLVRFNDDGSVDGGFGTAGVLTYQAGTLRDLVVLPDDKILVVGQIGDLPGIVRFHGDGTTDDGFGSSGKVSFPMGTLSPRNAFAVAVAAGGTVYVAGDVVNGGSTTAVLYRVSAAGMLLGESPFAPCTRFQAVAVQPNPGRVVAGCAASAQVKLVAFDAAGAIDVSFGAGNGIADVGSVPAAINDLASRLDDRLVVAGTDFAGPNDWRLWGTEALGAADTTFDTVTSNVFSSANDDATSVIVTTGGQVVAALHGFSSNSGGAGLARYTADGTLDTTFGSGGVVVFGGIDFEPKHRFQAVTQDRLGRYVAVGNRDDGGLYVVRVWD